MKKADKRIIYTCIGYSKNGNGLVNYNGSQVEVPFLMKGEKGEISFKKNKFTIVPKIIKLLDVSPERVEVPCPYFEKCGACQILHFSKKEQAEFKQKIIQKTLGNFGKAKPISMMDEAEGYRNKCVHSFSISKDGRIISGLYKNFSHEVVEIDRCYVHDKRADDIARSMRKFMEDYNIKPYDEDKKKGCIRHLMTRIAQGTGDVLLTVVVGNPIPHKDKFIKFIVKNHPEIKTIVENINDKKTAAILGYKERVLFGSGDICDILCGKKFKISSKSFYQINRFQTEKLYNYVVELADIKQNEKVLDAYCGIGTIGIIASEKAEFVTGVELNKTAIKNAVENAKINCLKNINFISEDAGTYLKKNNKIKYDVVFLDPPREGCSKEFIESLLKNSPKRIIYISCNPETQARDLSRLKQGGFEVKKLKPFDMFVYSNHVECIALLQRVKS